jgi:hypothetical protein
MRVPRTAIATVALAAVALLCACGSGSGSQALVDGRNSRSLYVVSDDGVIYEYAPGAEHPQMSRRLLASEDAKMDGNGSLYVERSALLRYWPGFDAYTPIFTRPLDGYALDAAGDLYVAASDGTTRFFPATGVTATAVAPRAGSGFQGIAVDPRGRAYIASLPDGHVRIFDNGLRTLVGTIAAPTGLTMIAVDSKGRLYGISITHKAIYEWAGPKAAPTTISDGLVYATDVAFDRFDNAYVMNEEVLGNSIFQAQTGSVLEFGFGHRVPTRSIGHIAPSAMAFDDRGDLYLTLDQSPLEGKPQFYVYGPTGTQPLRRYDGRVEALIFGPASPGSRQPKPSAEKGGSTQ